MKKKIAVIGGDLRIIKLSEMLAKDGFEVYVYGMENINKENVIECKSIEEVVNKTDIVVGPIPLSSNGETINAPFSNAKIYLEKLVENLEDKIFIAGSIKQEFNKLTEGKKIQVIDILKREELSVLNSISTAEGAIQIAINETSKTLHGTNVLVMGFGRIGKILAKMLDGIGANVSCEARKNTDLAWIKAYGYKPININELSDNLGNNDIIINTIPYVLLDKENITKIKKDALVIDLASAPGGVDKEAIKQAQIKFIWALSLPGKVAPITSAQFIQETLYNIMKEIEV